MSSGMEMMSSFLTLLWLPKVFQPWITAHRLAEDNRPVAVPEGASAIEASKIKAGDKSYYYWKQEARPGEAAPIEEPTLLQTREKKEKERVDYTTIASYSFEGDGPIVKVYISMADIGKHPREQFAFETDVRSFSFRVMGYNGRNHRLQVPKLSEEVLLQLAER
mmetsp:Transcript_63984/g.151346  ORF Transcript_63984/g.151346 Transcript_63984/m.151346 type:complete len:164 (+) Transcript_63984:254-745(+)